MLLPPFWHCEQCCCELILIWVPVLCFLSFFKILWLHPWHTEVPRPGIKSKLQLLDLLPPVPSWGSFQARGQIGAAATSLHHNHSNAGIEPTTSWCLVGFVNHCATTETPRTIALWGWVCTLFKGQICGGWQKQANTGHRLCGGT